MTAWEIVQEMKRGSLTSSNLARLEAELKRLAIELRSGPREVGNVAWLISQSKADIADALGVPVEERE